MSMMETADSFEQHLDHHSEYLWHLTGAKAGPSLLVVGDLDALAPAVARLQALPSLVYMRGALMVAGAAEVGAEVDAVLELGAGGSDAYYWQILARAAELGMISGRGIPAGLMAA